MANKIALFTWLLLMAAITGCSKTAPPQPVETPISSTSAPQPVSTTAAPTPTESSIRGSISIWHAWDESELPALATIISAFQQEYPEVYFDVLAIPQQDLLARYQQETPLGSGPDILLGPAAWGEELFSTGLVEDLTPLVNPTLLENINPAALVSGMDQETLFSLPYSLQGVVLYRNKEISTLDADSLEELVSLAQTAANGEVYGAYLERSFFFSGGHLTGMGGMLADNTGQPAFNSQAGLTWVELLKTFAAAGPTSFQSDDDLQAFMEGRAGWIIDGTWNLTLLIEALGTDKLAIDPWPVYGPGRLSGYVQSENIYLSSQSEGVDRRAAWQFIEFLLSAQAQAYLVEIGRIPAGLLVNLSTSGSGPLIQQAITALDDGAPYPTSSNLNLYEVQVDSALISIFAGSNPEAALQAAQEAILKEIHP